MTISHPERATPVCHEDTATKSVLTILWQQAESALAARQAEAQALKAAELARAEEAWQAERVRFAHD